MFTHTLLVCRCIIHIIFHTEHKVYSQKVNEVLLPEKKGPTTLSPVPTSPEPVGASSIPSKRQMVLLLGKGGSWGNCLSGN